MAEMNTLNTRIKLKYDSYTNWYENNPVLLAGEVAIATVENNETNVERTGFTNLPNVVIKVGNGTANYRDLKFVSGLAADVHGWAKMPQNEFEEYLSTFIDGEIQDTDTRYTIMVEETAPYVIKLMATDPDKSDLTYDTLVASIDLSPLDTRLKAVEEALGENGSVSQQIADAIGALDYAGGEFGEHKFATKITQDDGAVSVEYAQPAIADVAGLTEALAGKQENLIIDGTVSEENKVATEATIASVLEEIDNADAAVEKQFVVAVKQDNAAISVERRALEAADIPVIEQNQVNGLGAALEGKQNVLPIDGVPSETNKVATQETVTKAVAGLEGAMHFKGAADSDPLTWDAEKNGAYTNGDVVIWGEYEYVWDGSAWLELGNTSLYQLKADAEAQHKAITDAMDELDAAKQDVVPFEHEPSEDDKAATVKSVTDRIAANNTTLAYAGGDAAEHKFATKVTQENGVIAAEYAQPAVADIAGLADEIARVDKAISDLDAAKQDNLPIDGTPSETNKVATQDTIRSLNNEDAAVAGEFVTAVSTVGGIAVPTRGKITTDHINQGELVLVFDCGTSAGMTTA